VQTAGLREQVVTIGRLPENTIVLAGPQVSGHHAEIGAEAHGVVLVDLASATGTFVDGVRLQAHQPYELADGALIQIGLYLLTYRAGEVEAEQARQDLVSSQSELIRPVQEVVLRSLTEPRPTLAPLLLDIESPSKYLEQLPIIFHAGGSGVQSDEGQEGGSGLFRRMLLIFENLWEQLEQRQDFIDMYFDPRTCPASFLRWLASWFDVAIDPHWPEPRIRALLLELIQLYQWRGTKYGLTRMVEVCAGVTPEITAHPSSPFVVNISVQLPRDGGDRGVMVRFIEELVNAHKPAHLGYVLEVRA
jgi:phage tail-like protein